MEAKRTAHLWLDDWTADDLRLRNGSLLFGDRTTGVARVLDHAPIASVLDVDQGVAMEELTLLWVANWAELAGLGLGHEVTALLLLDGVGETHLGDVRMKLS